MRPYAALGVRHIWVSDAVPKRDLYYSISNSTNTTNTLILYPNNTTIVYTIVVGYSI
jgi:hypothetical protein